MAKQTKLQRFKETATEEQWQALAQLINDAPVRTKALPTEAFPFSYAAISTELATRGLIKKRKRKNNHHKDIPQITNGADATLTANTFTVNDISYKIEKITRSVQLNADIYKRLQKIENNKGQYTHSAILNQLLDDALSLYGY